MKKTSVNTRFLGAATLAAACLSLCAPVRAHVTLEYQVAPAGASYKAAFRVGHGCGASATREFVVSIPEGVRGAKPMVKPGWAIDVQRAKLAKPYDNHGQPVTEDVVRISWRAKTPQDALPSGFYDEFVLVGQMPQRAGPIYWPVSQVCDEGRLDWTEVPRAGQKLHDLKSPAAVLEILPAGDAGGHAH